MAKIRRAGFGTVFQVENETVGIGTTANSNTVQVSGTFKSSNVNVIGIATLPIYKGFLDKQTRLSSNEVDLDNLVGYVDGQPYYGDFHVHNRSDGTVVNMVGSAHTTVSHQVINDAANLKVDTLSGDIVIDGEFTVSSGTTYCTSVDQLTVTSNFSVPTGSTEDRIHCHTAGSMRFNEDTGTLEFYTGGAWKTVNSFKDTGNRGRAVFSGGSTPSDVSTIDYFQIHTLGNAINFGEATITESRKSGCASAIRGLSAGSDDSSNHDVIDYVNIASAGNAIDFGDMSNGRGTAAGMSSSTRGLWAGGRSPGTSQNTIDYVEIATVGNAVDFGDITQIKQWLAGCSSPTRGILGGGEDPAYTTPSGRTRQIEFITMASKGNSILFGDLTAVTGNPGSCSNSTRGFFGGGEPQTYSKIDMITIASTGDATDFGNLTVGRITVGGAGSQTRGTFIGGHSNLNVIDYITMSTAGNAQDFGDLTVGRWSGASFSDSHGGLGGF